jgi:HEAT repeat protein
MTTSRRAVSTASLLRLLLEGDPEEQCGAALVLGALRPPDPRVIPALGRALGSASTPVKAYLLDALGKQDDARIVPYVAPFLTVEGSLREQAVHVLRGQGPEVMARLMRRFERASEIDSDNRAYLRVFALAATQDTVRFLVGLLEKSPFDTVRGVVQAFRHAAPSYDRKVLGALRRALVELLGRLAPDNDPTAEVAALKIIGVTASPSALTPVLERTRGDRPPIIRHNALEALAQLPIPSSRRTTVAKSLFPLLEETDNPTVICAALRVLRHLSPPVLTEAHLIPLMTSPHLEVARAAVRDVVQFPSADIVRQLLDILVKRPPVQRAAAAALAAIDGSVPELLVAHDDPRFAEHQETLRTILASRSEVLSPATFRTQVRRLVDADQSPDVLQGRLLTLAVMNRPALNRAVESRARTALDLKDWKRVHQLLEPLVRHRYATPAGRYMLAIAHLGAAESLVAGDPHHDRAMQLLGPLARLREWRLRPRLLREDRVGGESLRAVIRHMLRRPEAERRIAEGLVERFPEPPPPSGAHDGSA